MHQYVFADFTTIIVDLWDKVLREGLQGDTVKRIHDSNRFNRIFDPSISVALLRKPHTLFNLI